MVRLLLIVLLAFIVDISHARCKLKLKEDIPPRAFKYLPYMYQEVYRLLPDFKTPFYFGALIEHESCISLCWSKCWNPKSRLKTSREEGAGLGQITRAWYRNGRLRFDTLADLKRRFRKELEELNWNNIYNKPRLQIRAMVLLWKGNWYKFPKDLPYVSRLAFSDASYNQGYWRTYKDRQLCKLKANCNPIYWFDNVEKTCTASKRKLYGNRSPCDISRHHVRDVLLNRLPKYYYDWVEKHCYLVDKNNLNIDDVIKCLELEDEAFPIVEEIIDLTQ